MQPLRADGSATREFDLGTKTVNRIMAAGFDGPSPAANYVNGAADSNQTDGNALYSAIMGRPEAVMVTCLMVWSMDIVLGSPGRPLVATRLPMCADMGTRAIKFPTFRPATCR